MFNPVNQHEESPTNNGKTADFALDENQLLHTLV